MSDASSADAGDFGPLADALMSSLASRSHQWRRWELRELSFGDLTASLGAEAPARTASARSWVRVVTPEGVERELGLAPGESASLAMLRLFDEGEAALPGPSPDAPEGDAAPTTLVPIEVAFEAERRTLRGRQLPAAAHLRARDWTLRRKNSSGDRSVVRGRSWTLALEELLLHDDAAPPSTKTLLWAGRSEKI